MKTVILFTTIIMLLLSTAHSQNKHNKQHAKRFEIEGTIKDLKTGVLYLEYNNIEGYRIIDSSIIQHNSFKFKGVIKEPTFANIYFEEGLGGSNLLFAEIFIEPGKMFIEAEKDSLRFLTLRGSASHEALLNLLQKKKPIWQQIAFIDKTIKPDKINNYNRKDRDSLFSRLHYEDSLFITNNPQSIISAYLISENMVFEHFTLPVTNIYREMPATVKNSQYGKNIVKLLKAEMLNEGAKAPFFNGKNHNGLQISLSDFKNKNIVLLDFWGSWCIPCRRLNPVLKYYYKLYHPAGLEIISIGINDKVETWQKAIAADSTGNWQHILDKKNIAGNYTVNAVPRFFLIDKQGKIIGRYNGKYTRSYGERSFFNLENDLKEIFKNTF